MHKQKGFTLIELMVVLAIIAILATAGISAYGGYIKKARDAKRLQDVSALQTVAISSFTTNGMSIPFNDFIGAIETANNNQLLIDPLDTKEVCLNRFGDPESECGYQYYQCANGGYVLQIKFESSANLYLYTEDKLNDGSGASDLGAYDIGNCDTAIGSDQYIR